MKWQDLLDHLITVEGECMEENYGKGKALNDADEKINAGIRRGYADLLAVRSTLMAAPELLVALQEALDVMGGRIDDGYPAWADRAREVIAKAKGS